MCSSSLLNFLISSLKFYSLSNNIILLDFFLVGDHPIRLAISGIRVVDPRPNTMALNTRTRDQTQNYEQLMKMLKTYNHKLENTRTNHEAKINELAKLIRGLAYQQTTLL